MTSRVVQCMSVATTHWVRKDHPLCLYSLRPTLHCTPSLCGPGPPTVSVLTPPYSPLYTLPVWSRTTHCVCTHSALLSTVHPPCVVQDHPLCLYSLRPTLHSTPSLCGPGPPTMSVLTPPYSPLCTLPVWSRTTHCVCTHSALLSTVHPPCVVHDHPLCLYSLRPTLHCTPSPSPAGVGLRALFEGDFLQVDAPNSPLPPPSSPPHLSRSPHPVKRISRNLPTETKRYNTRTRLQRRHLNVKPHVTPTSSMGIHTFRRLTKYIFFS